MLGSRLGSKTTLYGSVIGSAADDEGPAAGGGSVSRDGTSNIFVPANATEWSTFRTNNSLAIANPNSLWLCQEASGNLADSIGALTLTQTGTAPTYAQAQAGWSRLGILMPDGVTSRLVAAAGVGPDPSVTSQTWMFLVGIPTIPAASRTVFGINMSVAGTRVQAIHLITSGFLRNNTVGNNADGTTAGGVAVRPLILKWDRTGSISVLYSDIEKLVPIVGGLPVDGNKGIGESSGCKFLYGAMWSGAAAEASDTNWKALLTAMGYAPPWS